MPYQGKERRVHTCFITRNREYHIRAGVCVAVRDRHSSAWISGHSAMGLPLEQIPSGAHYLGSPLEFRSINTRVRTSTVLDILRPGKNEVQTYDLVHMVQPT